MTIVSARERIWITDVAPRDGLQNQPVRVSTSDKLDFIRLLADAGLSSIEVASFVSPRAVPQMADSAEVVVGLTDVPNLTRPSVLVPNSKGLERAITAGAREIAVVLSATDTMNRRNLNMSLDETTVECERMVESATRAGIRTRAYLAVAVECPFEGPVVRSTLMRLIERMLVAGANEIVLADTIGAASPCQISALLQDVAGTVPLDRTACHFHDTRGFGVANVWVALNAGVRRFDSSAGGLGGCPFAPGAAGNVATEDVLLLAQQCGLESGIDLEALDLAVCHLERVLGANLGGRSLKWLRRSRC